MGGTLLQWCWLTVGPLSAKAGMGAEAALCPLPSFPSCSMFVELAVAAGVGAVAVFVGILWYCRWKRLI